MKCFRHLKKGRARWYNPLENIPAGPPFCRRSGACERGAPCRALRRPFYAGDLHTHTNFSDGSSDIELLPKLAARAGLTHLAVSDHDTTLSAEYAYKHPVVRGVHMIPAVELTGFDFVRGRRVHILCYWPKLTPALKEFCALMAARRNEATEKSMDELEALYPQFCREEAKGVCRAQRRHV